MTPDYIEDVEWLHHVMQSTGIQPTASQAGDWLDMHTTTAAARLQVVPGVWRYRAYDGGYRHTYRYALTGQACEYPPQRAAQPRGGTAAARLRALDQWGVILPAHEAARLLGCTPRRIRQIREAK